MVEWHGPSQAYSKRLLLGHALPVGLSCLLQLGEAPLILRVQRAQRRVLRLQGWGLGL